MLFIVGLPKRPSSRFSPRVSPPAIAFGEIWQADRAVIAPAPARDFEGGVIAICLTPSHSRRSPRSPAAPHLLPHSGPSGSAGQLTEEEQIAFVRDGHTVRGQCQGFAARGRHQMGADDDHQLGCSTAASSWSGTARREPGCRPARAPDRSSRGNRPATARRWQSSRRRAC